MAMFPPAIPHFFIRWLTERNDVVYDPFSGRGTTALEACLLSRVGLGSDANPMAWTLTSAKCAPPSRESLLRRIRGLNDRISWRLNARVPDKIAMLFHPTTLSQLVWLQNHLSFRRKEDRFIYAILLGILHANARADGTPRGLTVSMPNTFAMAPNYVEKYVSHHSLVAPEVDVLNAVVSRISRLTLPSEEFGDGRCWMQDARQCLDWPKDVPKAKLIFASPPYLQVMKYGKMNWIRLWLLGHEPRAVDKELFSSASLPKYLDFMSTVLTQLSRRVRSDGYVCLVIGDVRKGNATINLARAVVQHSVPRTQLRPLALLNDHLPVEHKVSRIWGKTRGRATKTDRILILGAPKAKDLLPFPTIDWLSEHCYGG
jgi:site-specific DNA-methyltransferase (adenine-specific)